MLSRLRESWIVPAALLVLAVGVLVWFLLPVVWGGENSAGEPVSSQPEVAQQPEEPPQTEDPAPGVESRNVASYSAFEGKDPFGTRSGLAEEPVEETDQAQEGEQAGTEPGEDPEADARGPAAQREGRARDGAPEDRGDPSRDEDDFSVLEAAEGERGAPQDGAPDSGAPGGGSPAADGRPGSGGVGGDGPGDRREAFENGGGPRGPSK